MISAHVILRQLTQNKKLCLYILWTNQLTKLSPIAWYVLWCAHYEEISYCYIIVHMSVATLKHCSNYYRDEQTITIVIILIAAIVIFFLVIAWCGFFYGLWRNRKVALDISRIQQYREQQHRRQQLLKQQQQKQQQQQQQQYNRVRQCLQTSRKAYKVAAC